MVSRQLVSDAKKTLRRLNEGQKTLVFNNQRQCFEIYDYEWCESTLVKSDVADFLVTVGFVVDGEVCQLGKDWLA